MKKSLLAVGLTLAMVLTMATPAFAANSLTNVNADGTEITLPGNPGVAQVAGESFNAANITSKDGVKWETVNDDDKLAGALDTNGADINVWAKVVDSGSKIYKVDLAWGAMKFEYNSKSGQWNTTDHKYDTAAGTGEWTVATYLDGTNNKVGITNHSNNGINAAFAFAMNGTKFNDAAGKDNVVGNFFDTNEKAAAAALTLADTYDATGATITAVPSKLAGPVALATADAYNSSATPPTTVTDNKLAGARTSDVFFAFSGTPDKGKGKTLDTFKKVGVITVTVTPNNDLPLNQAPYVAVP